MEKSIRFLFFVILLSSMSSCSKKEQKIDRKALVTRHNVVVTKVDTLASLTVGNGKFAFTVDATGMQSFPDFYKNGVPLGTQSEWGWHTSLNTENYRFDETLKPYNFNGNENSLYAVQYKEPERNVNAVNYFRANPHRLQLGNVGLEIIKKDGTIAKPNDLDEIHQELNVWTGKVESRFKVEGVPIHVITYGNADKDAIAVKVESPLVQQKRIKIKFRFPYPTIEFADRGTNYSNSEKHKTTVIERPGNNFLFSRTLDNDTYFVNAKCSTSTTDTKVKDHYYTLLPNATNSFEIIVEFSPSNIIDKSIGFNETKKSSIAGWKNFWLSGGAVDFSGSTDPRAYELERRVVLSQYLTRVQCAGQYPIQETGLTYNSWYGKPHMEMYWWHAAHYALWGRTELLKNSMQWYFIAYDNAKKIADRQGYKGVRWQKMTDHNAGESPSNVGSFLIWQQPHVIYLAELIYRNHPSKEVLEEYQKLVFSTADFMASFPNYDVENDRYILGKGVIPAQECFNKLETYNPPFELAYWKWALQVAQKWRKRLGLGPVTEWQKIIDKLSPLAQKNGVYLAAESVPDSYSTTSKHIIDHPAVLGALSMLPQNNYVDISVMNRTFDFVDKAWHWDHTWGWDFPLEAMTATRLNRPKDAIKALFRDETTNTYLLNGHNYQTPRLTLYLPGNGGLLSAIALMCAGYDGCTNKNPGFPKDGTWNVKWEGLNPMP